MTEPEWIEPGLAEIIHAEQIERHGGAVGIRDAGRLEGAMARPRNLHAYEGADLFRLAASYAHGLARGHPFVDGNKRTSFVVSATFLAANGYRLAAPASEVFDTWTKLASGTLEESELADWFRAFCAGP